MKQNIGYDLLKSPIQTNFFDNSNSVFDKDFYEEENFYIINYVGNKLVNVELYKCTFASCCFTGTIIELII